MKIDWSEAPEWANYAAMDDDGSWYWYEFEPVPWTEIWFANGRVEQISVLTTWRDSLQERPK